MALQLSICPIERFSNLCRVVALQIRNTHNLMDGAKRIFLTSCTGKQVGEYQNCPPKFIGMKQQHKNMILVSVKYIYMRKNLPHDISINLRQVFDNVCGTLGIYHQD